MFNTFPRFKKCLIFTAVSVAVSFTSTSAFALSYDERLERLERMAENNLYIQFSQRLNEQERSIQKLEDKVDILTFEKEQFEKRQRAEFEQLNQRIQALQIKLEAAQSAQPLQPQVPVMEPTEINGSMELSLATPPQVAESTTQPVIENKVAAASGQEVTPVVMPDTSLIETVPAANDSLIFNLNPRFTRATTDSEMKTYQQAFKLMLAGKRPAAIEQLKVFVKQHPESDITPSALFWLGEAYFVEREYESAYIAFKQNIEWYPDSDKASDSIARAVKVQNSLGNVALAEALKKELLVRYPDSEAAKQLTSQQAQ